MIPQMKFGDLGFGEMGLNRRWILIHSGSRIRNLADYEYGARDVCVCLLRGFQEGL